MSIKATAALSILVLSGDDHGAAVVRGEEEVFVVPSRDVRTVPCLEPLRRRVREQCFADATALCARQGEPSIMPPPSPFPFDSLFRDVGFFQEEDDPVVFSFVRDDAALRSVFLPDLWMEEDTPPSPPVPAMGGFPFIIELSAPNGGDKGSDDFSSLIDGMLDLSLRVFDMTPSSPEGWFVLEGGEDAQDVATVTQEGMAVDALDVLVASLFRRAGAGTSSDGDDLNPDPNPSPDADDIFRHPDPNPSADVEESIVGVAEEVSVSLAAHGFKLLEDGATRRRLAEDGGANPRAEVRDRLARRLTEYSSDVFSTPGGFVSVFSFLEEDHEERLGLGSPCADRCLAARYDLGASGLLSQSCRDAVGTLKAASFASSFASANSRQPAATHSVNVDALPCPYSRAAAALVLVLGVFLSSLLYDNGGVWCRGFIIALSALMAFSLSGLIGGVVVVAFFYFVPNDDEDEDEEDSEEDKATADEQKYVLIAEGDNDTGHAKKVNVMVFEGIPVQVV